MTAAQDRYFSQRVRYELWVYENGILSRTPEELLESISQAFKDAYPGEEP